MKIYLLILFIFTSICSVSAQNIDPDKELRALSGIKKNIGLASAYSIQGETQWSNAAGFSCQEESVLFSETTKTRIASIAKSFTAVAIMQLVEVGSIDLDTTIETYLNDLPEDKKQITVRQLLGHTSGLPQYRGEDEIENTIRYESLQEAMEVFIKRPLLFDPGTQFFYTTYGYVVLGRIIEALTSVTYEAYMKKNIFDVADMQSTLIESYGQPYENSSCLYHHNGRKAKTVKQNDLSNRIPGGGFLSTLEDVMKFAHALLNGKLIAQETLDEMIKPQSVEYDGNKYALGWYLYGPPPNENLVIGHSGGQTGCTSQLMIVPKTKTVVVVLSNTSGNYPEVASFASSLIGYSENSK